MRKKYFSVFVVVMAIAFLAVEPAIPEVSVGVKQGDWIEYEVTTGGNPPEQHNVKWARMEIVDVQGPEVKANVTTEANNGTISSLIMPLNLEKGEIGAWFIIHSNLKLGDTFYDINLERNITIEGQEQLEYADAMRTVTNATTSERIKRWDKATGVFVMSIDTLPGFSVNATATKTNMWSSQILGLEPEILGSFVIIVGYVIIVIAVALILRRRSFRKSSPKKT